MKTLSAFLSIITLTCVGIAAAIQTSSTSISRTLPSDSVDKQAFVQESIKTNYRYESNGTGVRRSYGRFRIQNEAGVQQLGLIKIGYNTAFEKLTIDYLRVIKPDGQIISASTTSIQDLPAEVQRLAPTYSDYREKHIAVPSLRPGDKIEYSFTADIHTAMVPGQFWIDYSFDRANITLDEQLEIDVPVDRKLKFKFAPGFEPKTENKQGRHLYSWTHSNNKLPDPADEASEVAHPDIQITTFQDWSEVARWYSALEKPRRQVDERIRTKVLQLTQGLSSQDAKLQAVYAYVSAQVRYIGLSFGIGRFQPQSAVDVFENSYGDCKDKHTLLAAMLSVVGISADAVLIGPYKRLDSDVPSPSQFNHLITAVGTAKGMILMDTTAEVAPLGYLIPPLRSHEALRVSDSAAVVTTAADPPNANVEDVSVDARINSTGDLDANVTVKASGDPEMILRSVLRSAPESQWPVIFKAVAEAGDLSGEVSDLRTSEVSNAAQPLVISFRVSKAKYIDWAAASKISLPIVKIATKAAYSPDQKKAAIQQGSPAANIRQLRLELPTDKSVLPPLKSGWTEDFAEYKATYSVEGNVLIARREYRIKMSEVPRSRYQAVNKLVADITTDQAEQAEISVLGRSAVASSSNPPLRVHMKDAERAFEAAQAAFKAGKLDKSESELKRAVEIDPSYTEAWLALGRMYARRGAFSVPDMELAANALQSALNADPKNNDAFKDLVAVLFRSGKFQATADVIRKYSSEDISIPAMQSYLSMSLLFAGKPAEAIPVLEKEVAASSEPSSRTNLARAYFETGNRDKALEAVQPVLNSENAASQAYAAILLADENVELDRAEHAALSALNTATRYLQNADFPQAKEDFRTWKLTWIWDAIGWISWRKGNAAHAHEYLEAAWSWSHYVNAGDHLARVYLEEGRKSDALRIWAQAFSNSTIPYPDIMARFVKAAGSEAAAKALIDKHRLDFQEERTVQFPNTRHLSGSAEVRLLIGSKAKVVRADVDAGDDGDDLMPYLPDIRALHLPLSVPNSTEVRIFREGVLSCTKLAPTCMLVLTPAPVTIRHENNVF